MKTVPLGRSALRSSQLAYGCWRIAGPVENAPVTAERETHAVKAISTALDCGFTMFDLADVYSDGHAEELFGHALRQIPGMRDRVVISTKCGIRKQGDPDQHAPYRYDFTSKHIIESAEKSLRRMGTDVIDLYQLHRPDYLANPIEVADAFTRLKQSGKVKEFGISNARPTLVAVFQRFCPMQLVVNQVEISLMKLDCFHDGTLDQCMLEGITPLAWSPLGGGRLSYAHPVDLHDPIHAKRLKLKEELDHIARHHNVNRAAVALAWLLMHPSGIVPIVGTTNPEHICETTKAVSLQLSREEWYRLMEAAVGHRLP
ncbi:MAG TPA: aldo/keto reductase [Methylomirabilota bacterium]|nr:aldo/keto reductase [Methylomirabilota bacterium]